MLDKTGQTGSPLQLVNGLILISTFGGARLVYGSFMVRTLLLRSRPLIWHRYLTPPPVVPVLPNTFRRARRAFERSFRRVHFRKCYPERLERVLVRSITPSP